MIAESPYLYPSFKVLYSEAMRILIATPLYPPDTALTAQYVKELAGRLSKDHVVTILLYGYLPEEVRGVKTISIDKRKPVLLRVFLFLKSLLKTLPQQDLLLTVNGRSVEIPVFLAVHTRKIPLIFLPYDTQSPLSFFGRRLQEKSKQNISFKDLSLTRPEILPFQEYPADAFRAYEHDWESHLATLI